MAYDTCWYPCTPQAFDLAKKQGYVVLRGTGYRRERKGSPLLNIFRQFCDAKAMVCTCVITVRKLLEVLVSAKICTPRRPASPLCSRPPCLHNLRMGCHTRKQKGSFVRGASCRGHNNILVSFCISTVTSLYRMRHCFDPRAEKQQWEHRPDYPCPLSYLCGDRERTLIRTDVAVRELSATQRSSREHKAQKTCPRIKVRRQSKPAALGLTLYQVH